jgi:hypothetical protein
MPGKSTLSCLVLALFLGCKPTPVDATPEGATRDFIEKLGRFEGRSEQAQKLYERLSERSKANLRARANRYGAASGKKIEPWAMLVASRSRARFVAQVYNSQIVGQYALVAVQGALPADRAQVPCVYEKGGWRIDLVLPALSILPLGPGRSE